MTILELYQKGFDAAVEELMQTHDDITTYETLKEFIKSKLDEDSLMVAAHLLNELNKCPHCGNYFKLSDAEETTDEDGDTVYICPCKHCKEPISEYDLEQIDLYEYLSDAYDIEYIINSRKEYQSVRITVATGGPAIWIDTDKRAVCLAWWGETAQANILPQTCNAIDEYGEQLYAG